jgi:hypothetical protein
MYARLLHLAGSLMLMPSCLLANINIGNSPVLLQRGAVPLCVEREHTDKAQPTGPLT